MRIPDPTGLRCPHPCLPTPWVSGRRLLLKEDASARSSRPRRESERLRIAAQLLALTSLLGELDLWPGRAALRRAVQFQVR